jgi:endonuclease III
MSGRGGTRAADICRVLDLTYRQPDLGNQTEPVAELIYILLSTMTTETNYQRSFGMLRERFSKWEELLSAKVEDVQETISSGGLAPTKARLIQGLLARLQRDWGDFDLTFMHAWPTVELRRYFTSLPGIGYKAATCVVAYCFGRDVCPVDTHTYRVSVRLGLIPASAQELGRQAHIAIERALPSGQRLAFHINAIAHGRQRCHLKQPCCQDCPVAAYCVAPEHGRYSRKDRLIINDTHNAEVQE